ncbi:hypothetical protein THF1C08_1130002 [Vibrio jasicida]|uniref:Uncharacterized protein n=1 Tax=Vibrio jasicida TaxID=766224 RepID=A0AAU9QJ08_9VIBR|nr:hypothetical protein THF1C08_1130002 [Vibrio jasicida]CAH1572268.1 hypothetical protein THF1A12_1160002 [Vibrio jasicida]
MKKISIIILKSMIFEKSKDVTIIYS